MPYRSITPLAGQQAIATTDTVQNHALGLRINAIDPIYGSGEFIYLKGVASTAVGDVVLYDEYLGTTTRCPATGGVGAVAIAMSANVANQFGWYQISGSAVVRAPNAMTPGAAVFMQGVGAVDDASVAGEQILNATVSTTTGVPSTGLAVIQLDRSSIT